MIRSFVVLAAAAALAGCAATSPPSLELQAASSPEEARERLYCRSYAESVANRLDPLGEPQIRGLLGRPSIREEAIYSSCRASFSRARILLD